MSIEYAIGQAEGTVYYQGGQAEGTIYSLDYDRRGRLVGAQIKIGSVVVWRAADKQTGRIQ
jgi:YD repeat-containing protein